MINLPKNLKGELQQTKTNRLIEADKKYNEKVTENINQTAQDPITEVQIENESATLETQVQEIQTEMPPEAITTSAENEDKQIEENNHSEPILSITVDPSIYELTDQKEPTATIGREKKTRATKPIETKQSTLKTTNWDPKQTVLEQTTGEEWFNWFQQAEFEEIVSEFIKQYPKKNETIKYEKEQRNILLSDELFARIKQQLKKIDRMCEDIHESNAEDAKAHSNRGWIGWYIENVLRAHFNMEPMRRGKN